MTEDQLRKVDQIMSESDILDDDAVVEFVEDGFKIVFGAISDWYNKSITIIYKEKCELKEMICLLWELAIWVDTPKHKRSNISDVMRQYLGKLPEPKISVKTHIIG